MDDFIGEHYNTIQLVVGIALATLVPVLAVWIEVKLGLKPKQKPMERWQAEKFVRNGSTAGFVSAAITLAINNAAVFAAPAELAKIGLNGWLLADAALIAFLAWRIRRASRVAAVTLLVYFLAAKISLALATGQPLPEPFGEWSQGLRETLPTFDWDVEWIAGGHGGIDSIADFHSHFDS